MEVDLEVAKVSNINGQGRFHKKFETRSFSQKEVEKLTCKKGDLLVVKSSGSKKNILSGKTAICEFEHEGTLVATNFLMRLRPNKELVEPKYLWYVLNSIKTKNFIKTIVGATTYPNLKWNLYGRLKIELPTLAEQQRVTAILDKADEIRNSMQQIQNIRSELVDSIFFDMFGDPITNPNNYKFFKLIELMSDGFQNGLYIPQDRYVDSDGVEMVHMSDAFYDTVQRGCLKQALLEVSEITKYNLSDNNLLITRRSLNYEGAAKSCRIPQSNNPLVFESSLIRLTPDEKVVNATFLHFYINNKRVREAYVYKFVTKSTISGINQKNLSQIPVMLPPIELQNKFMQNINFLQQIPDSMELSTNNLASIIQEMLT